MNINNVVIAGRIGFMKSGATANGTTAVKLRIATSKHYKDKQSGERIEKTTWINAVAYSTVAENVSKYFQKGDPIYIEGSLEVQTWDDKHQQSRETVEVLCNRFQFVGSKSNTNGKPATQQATQQPANQAPSGSQAPSNGNQPETTDLDFDYDQPPF